MNHLFVFSLLLIHVPSSAFQSFADTYTRVLTKPEHQSCLQRDFYTTRHDANPCNIVRSAVCNLSGPFKRKYPPIPLITTFEKNVILPGESIHIDMPSPGTVIHRRWQLFSAEQSLSNKEGFRMQQQYVYLTSWCWLCKALTLPDKPQKHMPPSCQRRISCCVEHESRSLVLSFIYLGMVVK